MTRIRRPWLRAARVDTGTAGLKWARLAAALIAAGTSIGSAEAGDLYIRAGAGLDRPTETAFTDLACSSVSPATVYGCGRGGDGAPYRSVGDFGMVPVLELGLGYAAAPAVRLEVLAEYRPRFAFGGRANFLETGRRQSVSTDLSSLSAMLAAWWVDLTGLGVPRLGSLEPFVGAGVGAVHNRIGETRMTFPVDEQLQLRLRHVFDFLNQMGWLTEGPTILPERPGASSTWKIDRTIDPRGTGAGADLGPTFRQP